MLCAEAQLCLRTQSFLYFPPYCPLTIPCNLVIFPLLPMLSHKLTGTKMLFFSSYQNKIDKKGRISVPASFRAALAQQEAGCMIPRGRLDFPEAEGREPAG